MPATGEAANYEAVIEAMQEKLDAMEIQCEIVWEKRADKRLIAKAAKDGVAVPGTEVRSRRAWRIA